MGSEIFKASENSIIFDTTENRDYALGILMEKGEPFTVDMPSFHMQYGNGLLSIHFIITTVITQAVDLFTTRFNELQQAIADHAARMQEESAQKRTMELVVQPLYADTNTPTPMSDDEIKLHRWLAEQTSMMPSASALPRTWR